MPLSPEDIPNDVMRVLTCHCGERYVHSSQGWLCHREGHSRVIPQETMLPRLMKLQSMWNFKGTEKALKWYRALVRLGKSGWKAQSLEDADA